MINKIFILIFVFTFCCKVTNAASVFDWFNWDNYVNPFSFGKNDQQPSTKQEQVNLREGVTLISVPFEELSPEDKFLQEAHRLSGVSLSGIDTCEHRVVMKIQSSCSDINEEELAKLSIGLLNCQSEISGRPQIVCTEEMSLKECTAPMDSELWNAYHTINNRARAVCYATRQVQFRALSEMTVNKLMSSALKQLTTMDDLEEIQKELNRLTSESVASLREGQQGLMDQNSGLKLAQRQVQDNIVANLKQLTQEKTIIQSMQHQLHTLSEKLSQELGEVESQLESQSEQHQTIHQNVLSKLVEISVKTDAIWDVLDDRSRKLQKQQDEMKKSAAETMENLRQINASVNYLVGLVGQVRAELDEKMAFISSTIGGDGPIILSIAQHSLYLIAGVLVSLFLQLSLACRLILLTSVLSNVALVYQRKPLSFLGLTATIIGLWIVALLAPICWSWAKKSKSRADQRPEYSKVVKENEDDDKLSTKSSSRAGSVSTNRSVGDFGEDTDSLSSLRFRSSVSRAESRSQPLCGAVCRNGQLCRSTPVPGLKFCRRHIER